MDDLRIVGNENLTLEMYIMQLVHLKNIDDKKINYQDKDNDRKNESKEGLIGESKSKEENLGADFSTQVKNQLKNTEQLKASPIKNLSNKTDQTKIEIRNYQDLIDRAKKEKEIELKFDLERNVKLVSFNKGKIDISFNVNLNKNFIKNLSEKLLLWTGERWIISLSKEQGEETIYEKNLANKKRSIMEP